MLRDILAINDQHIAAAEAIVKRVGIELNKLPKTYKFILGISGETGTGKSELSHMIGVLLKKQHIRVKVLHTGNYYNIQPLLLIEWRKAKGIESVGVNEYDWNLIRRNIMDFKEDRESMLPLIDPVPEQVDKLITDYKKIDFLIISGLYAIKSDGIDLRVFIDLDFRETKLAEKLSAKKPLDEFNLKVLEKEHQNVQSLKSLADLIVNKNYQVVDARTGESLMD